MIQEKENSSKIITELSDKGESRVSILVHVYIQYLFHCVACEA